MPNIFVFVLRQPSVLLSKLTSTTAMELNALTTLKAFIHPSVRRGEDMVEHNTNLPHYRTKPSIEVYASFLAAGPFSCFQRESTLISKASDSFSLAAFRMTHINDCQS